MPAYSTPRADPATPSSVPNGASRRFSPYPTSLRTSLFRSAQPSPPGLSTPRTTAVASGGEVAPSSTYTARSLPSRVPLLASASLPSSKRRLSSSSSASLYAPSPRVASPQSVQHRAPRRSLGSAPSNGVDARTNPFEALSAPAFDDFISNLTSTLRDSLDPTRSTSAWKAARERRQLEKEAERRQREQDEQSEKELLDRVRAATEAQAAPDETEEEQDEVLERDVFGEVKEVGSAPLGVNGLDIVAAAIQVAEEVAGAIAPETSLPLDELLESDMVEEVAEMATTTAEEAAMAAQLALAQHRADVDRLYSDAIPLDAPPTTLPEADASPSQTEEILLLDSDDEDDQAAGTAMEETPSESAEVDDDEREQSPPAEAAADQFYADAREDEQAEEGSLSPLRFGTVEQEVAVTMEDLASVTELHSNENVPLPSYLSGLAESAAPLSDPLEPAEPSAAPESVGDDDQDDLEMREYAPPGGRQPLFVSRATASATTSEADGDELFHVESVERSYSEEEEEDHAPSEEEVAVEVAYETAGQDGIRAEDFAGLQAAARTFLSDNRDRSFDDAESDSVAIDEDDMASAIEDEGDDADADADADGDPTVRKDPFGRPIRYEDYGSEVEYDENDIREDPLMRSYEDDYDETRRPREEDASVRDTSVEDGGSAMDSAEAEWAGRRKVDRNAIGLGGGGGAEENGGQVETLELGSDSDSEAQVGDEADIDELDQEADQLGEASSVLVDAAPAVTENSAGESGYPESTATTPGLATPMLLTPALSDYVTDPGLASGALADVDEAAMPIESTTGDADAPIGFARDDDDDDVEDGDGVASSIVVADSSVEMDGETPSLGVEQVALPLIDPVPILAGESAAVPNVAPIEVDVSDAELADIEAEDAEPDRAALPVSEAPAAAIEATGPTDSQASPLAAFAEVDDPMPTYDTIPALATQEELVTAESEQATVMDEQSSPSSPAAMAVNPLEALYADEDSEYSLDRIPYEKKGKGKAIDNDNFYELGDYENVGVGEDAGSDGSSPSSVAEDDIEMALAQWHSVADQLAGYSNSELVEKLIELQDQHDAAERTGSSLELLIRVQLYDFQVEYERRVKAGDIQESDEEDGAGQSTLNRSADGKLEYDYSDYPDRNDEGDELGPGESYGDEYHDEEYERATSEAPPSPDRSAFPETRSPSPAADPSQAAEREATDARIAQIAGDLVEMYESSGGAHLHVPASTAPIPAFELGSVEQASPSLHNFDDRLASTGQNVEAEEGELIEAERNRPPTSQPAAPTQSSIDATTFAPRLDAPLEPHRPFIRSLDSGLATQRLGNIEYELAPPVRATSPPRFERPPTEHNVDSPVTSADEQEDYRQIDTEMVRVGVDEEEMLDSTLVGRERPLGIAADASVGVRHEQEDTELPARPQDGLLIVDDDEDLGEPAVVEPMVEVASLGSASPTMHRQYGATPPPATEEAGQDMRPILDGVAPPTNFDIVRDPVETPLGPPPAHDEISPVSAVVPSETGSIVAEQHAQSDGGDADGPSQPVQLAGRTATGSVPVASSHINRETATEIITSDSRVPYAVPPTMHREDSPLEEGEVAEDGELVRVGVMQEETRDSSFVGEARPLALAIDVSTIPHAEQQDTQAAPLARDALVIIDDDEAAEYGSNLGKIQQERSAPVAAEGGRPASPSNVGTTDSAVADDSARLRQVESFPAGVAPPQNPSILPEPAAPAAPLLTSADYVALEIEDDDDPDTETDRAVESGLEPSGDDYEQAVLGLGADETVQPTSEAPTLPGESEDEDQEGESAAAATTSTAMDEPMEERQRISEDPPESGGHQPDGSISGGSDVRTNRSTNISTVQVIIEVDTDGEGDKPTEVESVRGSSLAVEERNGHDDSLDVTSVHSTEYPIQEDIPDVALPSETGFAEAPEGDRPTAPPQQGDFVRGTDFAQMQPGPSADNEDYFHDDDAMDRAEPVPSGSAAPDTDSESEDDAADEEVAAMLLNRAEAKDRASGSASISPPRKPAGRKRRVYEDTFDAENAGAKPRRSARLSSTPAPIAKNTRSSTPMGPQATGAHDVGPKKDAARTRNRLHDDEDLHASRRGPSPRAHRHRHHVPEVHGSDTDDGMAPPVTRSHCHFERLRIRSRAYPEAPPYLFNVPACALSSEVARDTLKAFEAEDLGPVDETDGCEGIQLGGVTPTDAYAIEVMASRHSSLVPHDDVLDAVRRIAGPELWDEGACEVVPLEEARSASAGGKRKVPEGGQESRVSPKKRRA